ncbi:MAG: YciI family protein [Hyphomicrobiaceae bacterium]|nr:YciI family protein [Hyphomicrobiaceae bacterium]
MQYILTIYANEAGFAGMPKEAVEQAMASYGAYNDALNKAKVFVAGERLRPASTASTVRMLDGKSKVQDGPYAETKEQLGGFYIIDVPDLDAALKWAAKCPGAHHGIVEVRAIWSADEGRGDVKRAYS